MMQDIIVITLVIIVTWLAISNALLRIKNDIVTAELSLKNEGESLIKFMQNWRDEDARIKGGIIGYDNNNRNTGDVDTGAMEDDTKAR